MHFGLLRSHVYPTLKIHWFRYTFCEPPLCARNRLDTENEDGRDNVLSWDFPDGPVVKNPPSSAGDAGSIPGRETKIPHAAGQLSPRAATTEPVCCN